MTAQTTELDAAASDHPAPRGVLVAATLALFLVWSNTFVAFEVLLAPHVGRAPLDWFGLTVARMLPAGAVCAAWCFGARRRESMEIVRAHPVRLLGCGALVVLVYNGFLYHAMQNHVAGPVASVVTSLTPLWLTLFGVVLLGERMTARKSAGLALGLGGILLLASAKETSGEAHGLRIAEAAVAPLAWSVYSALTKPVTRTRSPILWTYLVLVAGAALLAPIVAFTGAPDVTRLDGTAVAWLAFLALGASVGGNAVWSWLLRRLPASTVGLTVFLNPPMTLASKFLLATLWPAGFAFAIAGVEWAGGALMLIGVASAVYAPRAKTG
jgi:drug/metabolite transporter (DMT)-like permease